MRDKTIGCICTNDDPIKCLRDRYSAIDGEDSEGEPCSCCCHDYPQEEAKREWDEHYEIKYAFNLD